MNPRVKEAVLWGVVGFLTFLVLLQGYELLEGLRVGLAVKAGAAVVVFLATTVITFVASGRVPAETGDSASTQRIDRSRESTDDGAPVEGGSDPGDGNDGNDRDDDVRTVDEDDEGDNGDGVESR